nr:PREDICTED: transcription elongation factor spt5-like isoform X1 [Lepisosteus oculatus]
MRVPRWRPRVYGGRPQARRRTVLCAAMLSVWRRAELGFLIVLTWSCTGLVRGRLTGSDFLKAYGETDPDYDRSDEPPDPPGYGARASRWPGVGERLDAGGDASTLMRVDSVRETARPGQPVPAPAHGTEPGRILEAGRRPSPIPGSVLMDQPLGSRDPDWMSGSRQPAPDSHWEPSLGGAQGEVSGPPPGSWLRRGPRVHCGADGMTLTVRGRRADDIAVAPGGATPIPLSQLPPHCGVSWRKTWRELVLTVPYTGCATSQQPCGDECPAGGAVCSGAPGALEGAVGVGGGSCSALWVQLEEE